MLSLRVLLSLAAAAAAASSSLAAPTPTPCLPTCICTATSYSCVNRNITAFPADMFLGWGALETVNLAGNRATSLPAGWLSGLPALASLDISGNPLTSLPAGWLSGLPALASLGLAGLPLNSSFDVAAVLGPQPLLALTTLTLDKPTLLGGGGACPDLSPLATLAPRLATLSARFGLTRIPPRSFAGLRLASLDLSKNSLPTLTNGSFDGLEVGEVKLEWCGISAIEPGAFFGLVAQNVDLYFNQISHDSLPAGGLVLPGVSALCLAGNPFDARVFAAPLFASAPRLTSLDFMGGMGLGPYIGELPPRAFASTPTLTSLQLFNSGISSFAPGAFEGLPNLVFLNIGFNLGFGAVPAHLFDPLPALQTLVINNGALGGDGALTADAFAHNPALAALDLSYNNPGIAGLPPALLARCDKLATIDLSYQNGGLALARGTFAGINASGALQAPVSINLIHDQMAGYAGFTKEPEIVAAICAEAQASPVSCSVAWSPQDPPAESEFGAGWKGFDVLRSA